MGLREIIHVDMDAFFASVEQRDHPELRGRPVVVGGAGDRGVVAAASYEARRFGIHSAMAMVEARRRCPHLLTISGRYGRYSEVSGQVFAIFRRFTPLVEGLSIDEAFLDVTASRALFGDGETIARAIQQAIQNEVGLSASAGVAPCKFAAKIASDLKKPGGLVVVSPDVAGFLAPLPIEKMWGIGRKSAPRLRALGLCTLGDLARTAPDALEGLLGRWGLQVAQLARGIDDRPVVPERAAKSVGAEQTYDQDLTTVAEIKQALLSQAARVAARLHLQGQSASVVSIKIKYADFTMITRQHGCPEPVFDTDSIFEAAVGLLPKVPLAQPIRLTGVSVSGLVTGEGQQTLFDTHQRDKRRRLESVSQAIRGRFGGGTLTRATLLDRNKKR